MPIDPGEAYYYAGGRRRGLGESDLVALDLAAVDAIGEGERDALRDQGRTLTGEVVLVDREAAARVLGDRLRDASGVHPVYEAEGALVVVLPEVRVEGGADALDRVQRKAASTRTVVESDEGRLVLRPGSGRGEEALALANEIVESDESAGLDLAQARFLRVTPRPDRHP